MSARLLHAFCSRADGRTYAEGAPDQPAPWWSFSKTVPAAAVLRLAEQGRLDLDSAFRGAECSLCQLLAHTAGVANYGRLASYHCAVADGAAPWPSDQLLAAVGADRLLFQPGTNWAYSNVGYLFLREAIEQAPGMIFADALGATVLADRQLGDVRLATDPEDFDAVAWLAGLGYHPGWV